MSVWVGVSLSVRVSMDVSVFVSVFVDGLVVCYVYSTWFVSGWVNGRSLEALFGGRERPRSNALNIS